MTKPAHDAASIPVRKPLDARAWLLMIMLCLVWGIQQVAMKKVIADIAPIMQLALRFGMATVFFAAVVLFREGRRAVSDGTLRSGLVLGALFSLEFILVGQSLKYTSAAHSVVFLYTSPIFTALGLRFLPEEHLSRAQWCGIVVAFAGTAVAFLGYRAAPLHGMLLGDLLALLAGVTWGASNVALRHGRVGGAIAPKTVLYQVGTATLMLWLFASATGQDQVVFTQAALLSVAFQTVVISISSYLIWFWMLRHYLTSRLMLMSFLTPLFGVMFGAVLLGDKVDLNFGIGSLLVLAGILVVNTPPGWWISRRLRTA
jgi:drug/metabolite transporter (DMT)-like permease